MARAALSSLTIAELREFAAFSGSDQHYIRRSLDIGLGRRIGPGPWADPAESDAIGDQARFYQELPALRRDIPSETAFEALETYMGKLIRLAAFDLVQGRLSCFSAFRFLYERLLGPDVRPFLPSAFCAAAALPMIPPDRRKHLLQSISEAAATAPAWSVRAPAFYPEWIEKDAA